MKFHRDVFIIYVITAVLTLMWGCAPLGQDEAELEIAGEARSYPEVPDDYPHPVAWLLPEERKLQIPSVIFKNMVLMDRAQIKLWQSGDHSFVGASLTNEIFFPKYPGVIYVYWKECEGPDGAISRVVDDIVVSGRNDDDAIRDQLNNGKIPQGLKIVDAKEIGIAVNEFLSPSYQGSEFYDRIVKKAQSHVVENLKPASTGDRN